MNTVAVAKELTMVAKDLAAADAEEQTIVQKDMAAAKKLRPEMEKAYEAIADMMYKIDQELSSFNEPGLSAAFLKGLKAGIGGNGMDFSKDKASFQLDRYFGT